VVKKKELAREDRKDHRIGETKGKEELDHSVRAIEMQELPVKGVTGHHVEMQGEVVQEIEMEAETNDKINEAVEEVLPPEMPGLP